MKNKWKHVTVCLSVCYMLVNFAFPAYVQASDGEDYITISVDAVDDNAILTYALDTDDPAAFTSSNEFTVPAGTSHTIYVKDGAGNITSQRYEPQQPSAGEIYDDTEPGEDGQQLNIDLELGRRSKVDEPEYNEAGNPGTASVSSRAITDGSIDSEKVFYTFTTKEGEELYLVIDQGRGSDNVYLLDTVSLGDLRVLADGHESSSGIVSNNEKEDNLLSILAAEEGTDDGLEEPDTSKKKKSSSGNPLLVLLLVGIGGGVYYYLKIYRTKKDEKMDEMDAMDMDEFEVEEDDGEEVDFDYDDEEKQRYLDSLLDPEEAAEELLDADPDDYATSHMEDGGEDGASFDEEDAETEFNVDIF